jgi:4-hydroxyacetophenone monooxygenase
MTNTSSVPWEKSVSWPDHLRDACEDANIPTLLLVLHHLTGSDRWISEPYRPSRGKPLDDNDTGGLGADLQAEVRDAAWEAVMAYREGRL